MSLRAWLGGGDRVGCIGLLQNHVCILPILIPMSTLQAPLNATMAKQLDLRCTLSGDPSGLMQEVRTSRSLETVVTGLVSVLTMAAHMECSNLLTIEGDAESSTDQKEEVGRDMETSSGLNSKPVVLEVVVGVDHNEMQDPWNIVIGSHPPLGLSQKCVCSGDTQSVYV